MQKCPKKIFHANEPALVWGLVLVILASLFFPAAVVTAEDGTYLLNFDLTVEDTLYVFTNPYFDLSTWENGFQIEYVLDYNGTQISESISYSDDGYKGKASFKNIEIPYDGVEVEYYTETDVLVGDCHLQYHLKLREEPNLGKMVLSVPRLCSLGGEKILQVVDEEGYPLNTLYATKADTSLQGQNPASDTGTVSLNEYGTVENPEADETPEDGVAAPDAVAEDGMDQPIAEEDISNTEEQASDDGSTDLTEPGNENLPEAMAKENAVPENSPVVPDLESTLLQAPQPAPLKAPSAAEYELTFNLNRPGPNDNILEDLMASYYDHNSDLQDHGVLKDFSVNFNLYINRQQTPAMVKQMNYSDMSNDPWGNSPWSPDPITFDKIKIPYRQVDIEYYPEDGSYVEPYLLSYDLYLDESPADGKMILKLPRLEPSRHEYEKMPVVTLDGPKPAHALYLGGDNADDDNSGLQDDKPLATFAKAKEKATKDQRINAIYLNETLEIEGDFSLAGTNAKLLRGENFSGYMLHVSPGKTANLYGITLDGNKNFSRHVNSSLISIDNGTLNIGENVVLKDNINEDDDYVTLGGAIYASNNAIINMTGGIIQENRATFGGGIYLSHSTLNFSAGTINKNYSETFTDTSVYPTQYYSAGGGILADNDSTIYLSGSALISENQAQEDGGGIGLGTQISSGSKLIMTGGTIDGNYAGTAGGGIFVQAGTNNSAPSEAHISAGFITNNWMWGHGKYGFKEFGGGGIYVNGSQYGKNGELYLTNVVITDNHNVRNSWGGWDSGGGYAACPTTISKIYVTNGSAIYGNEAVDSQDLFILYSNHYGDHSGSPEYELSKRMLGGVYYNWKDNDNNLLDISKYVGKLSGSNDFEFGLHTDETGNALTQKLAKVFITGNQSKTKGAGIGSNGTVIIGEPGTTEVSVSKIWDDNNNADGIRPESITVDLMVELDGQYYVMDSATLHAENAWSFTFKDLPTKHGKEDFVYTVRESAVEGYTGEVSGNAESGFVITNSTHDTPPHTISIPVVKIWDDANDELGLRPESVTVRLLADGVDTGKTLVLFPENQWAGSFSGLEEYRDGKKINYDISEVYVDNYISHITGDASQGFVVTNRCTPGNPPQGPTLPTVVTMLPTLPAAPSQPAESPNQDLVQELPRTGESSNATLGLALSMVSAGFALLMLKKRKF